MLTVRLPIPGLEVDRPRLVDQRAVPVIDPVAGERAGPHELVVRGAIRTDGQRKRRPRGRGVDAKERLTANPARSGEPSATADGLDEADRLILDLRRRLQGVKRRPRDDHLLGADAERG